jgi:zinc protease
MKNLRTQFLTSALLLLSVSALAQQSLQLPPYQKTKLPNGLTVILMRQTEVPLVSFHVGIRAGAINDQGDEDAHLRTACF